MQRTIPQPAGLGRFGVESRDRLLPMEGLRGVAVGLVFLQHYCLQFLADGGLSGYTAVFASAFRHFGNFGVELFFVLSGFLIYGIVLKKDPKFLPFMLRRAQRLYPAFLVAFLIGIAADFVRPVPKIPTGTVDAAVYLGANLAFLPGLFPIEPLFEVNWSLSYEWWFYVCCITLASIVGLRSLKPLYRTYGIAMIGVSLVALDMTQGSGVPIRGLCFLSGLLLVEASALGWKPISASAASVSMIVVFAICVNLRIPEWVNAILLAAGFYAVCSAAFGRHGVLSQGLAMPALRVLGNISYSFYLVHGFVVVAALRLVLVMFAAADKNLLFWLCLPTVFAIAFCAGAVLFVAVEKPYSLR